MCHEIPASTTALRTGAFTSLCSFVGAVAALVRMISRNVGPLIITYTILGVPYSFHSIMGPNTLF